MSCERCGASHGQDECDQPDHSAALIGFLQEFREAINSPISLETKAVASSIQPAWTAVDATEEPAPPDPTPEAETPLPLAEPTATEWTPQPEWSLPSGQPTDVGRKQTGRRWGRKSWLLS